MPNTNEVTLQDLLLLLGDKEIQLFTLRRELAAVQATLAELQKEPTESPKVVEMPTKIPTKGGTG